VHRGDSRRPRRSTGGGCRGAHLDPEVLRRDANRPLLLRDHRAAPQRRASPAAGREDPGSLQKAAARGMSQGRLPRPYAEAFRIHTILVDFDALPEAHRRFFQSLPTNFNLPAPVVDCGDSTSTACSGPRLSLARRPEVAHVPYSPCRDAGNRVGRRPPQASIDYGWTASCAAGEGWPPCGGG
jgi:hypothetical protein